MGPPAGGAVLCLSLPVLEAVGEGRSSHRGCSATTGAVMAGESSGSARQTWTMDCASAKLKLSVRDTITLMTLTYLRAAAVWSTPWNSPNREERRDPIQEEEEVGEVGGRIQATLTLPRAIMTLPAVSPRDWVT